MQGTSAVCFLAASRRLGACQQLTFCRPPSTPPPWLGGCRAEYEDGQPAPGTDLYYNFTGGWDEVPSLLGQAASSTPLASVPACLPACCCWWCHKMQKMLMLMPCGLHTSRPAGRAPTHSPTHLPLPVLGCRCGGTWDPRCRHCGGSWQQRSGRDGHGLECQHVRLQGLSGRVRWQMGGHAGISAELACRCGRLVPAEQPTSGLPFTSGTAACIPLLCPAMRRSLPESALLDCYYLCRQV